VAIPGYSEPIMEMNSYLSHARIPDLKATKAFGSLFFCLLQIGKDFDGSGLRPLKKCCSHWVHHPFGMEKWRNTSSPTDVDLLSWAYHPSARENGLPLVRLVGFAGKSNMTERIRQKVRQRSAWNRRTLVAGLHSNSQPLWYQLFHGFSKRYWMLW